MKKILLILLLFIPLFSIAQKTDSKRQMMYGMAQLIFSNKAIGGGVNIGFMPLKFIGIGVGFEAMSFNKSESVESIGVPIFIEVRAILPTKGKICPMFSFNYGAFAYSYSDKITLSKYDNIEITGTGKSSFAVNFGVLIKSNKNPNRGLTLNFMYRSFSFQNKIVSTVGKFDNNGKYVGYDKTNNTTTMDGNYGAVSIGYKL